MDLTASLILDILDTAALLGFLLVFWFLYRLVSRISADMRQIEDALKTGFERTETTLQAILRILDKHGDRLDRLTPPEERGYRSTAATR